MNELLTGLEFIFYLLDLAYIKLQLLVSKSLGVEKELKLYTQFKLLSFI